jgi:ABC-type dipeptide/oligopeptide/nickel transport system ATPase component
MLKGRFVEVGPSVAVFTRPVHAYTKALLAAIPTIRRGVHREALAEPGASVFESQAGPMTQVEEGHFAAVG